jgi:hypothetical protein
MPGPYRLGKLPATHLAGVGSLGDYVAGKLPPPPASVSVPNASYPMDGNDQYGDCTIAGAAHLVAAWDAELSEKDTVPDAPSVIATYEQLTGGPDTGLNENNVLTYWRGTGLFGEEIAAYAPVDTKDIVGLHQAVAFYGGAYLGIACPESAQQQFAANQPWTYVPKSPIEGGHCIVALGYTDTALLCATWGGIAEVTYPFLAHYMDEAWAIISHQFVEAGRGPELDLQTLEADLDQFSQAVVAHPVGLK